MNGDNDAGIKLVRDIRLQDAKIRIVMVSGTAERKEVVEKMLKEAGGAAFIPKAAPGKSMIDRLEAWLRQSGKERQQ